MKKLTNKKKVILLLSSYFIILFTAKSKNNSDELVYNDDFNIYTNQLYGSYKDTHIFIGSKYFIENIKDTNDKNIYIIDDRYNFDPDMSICNSYKITNLKEIKQLLNMLLEYNNKYPSNWNRTYNSMKNEWLIHNICYYLNHEKERTAQVDFDNSDEELYLSFLNIINEIFNDRFDELLKDEFEKNNISKIKSLKKN